MSTLDALKKTKQEWGRLTRTQQAEAWQMLMAPVTTAQLIELSLEYAADRIRADLRLLPKPA